MKRPIKLIALLFPVLSCVSCNQSDTYQVEVDCIIDTYHYGSPMRYIRYKGEPYIPGDSYGLYQMPDSNVQWAKGIAFQAGDCYTLTLNIPKEDYEKQYWRTATSMLPATAGVDYYVTGARKKEIELHTVTYVSNEDYDLVSTVDGSVVQTPFKWCEEEDRSQCRYVFAANAYGKPIDQYDVGTSFDFVTTPLLPGILLGTRDS